MLNVYSYTNDYTRNLFIHIFDLHQEHLDNDKRPNLVVLMSLAAALHTWSSEVHKYCKFHICSLPSFICLLKPSQKRRWENTKCRCLHICTFQLKEQAIYLYTVMLSLQPLAQHSLILLKAPCLHLWNH